MADSTNTDIVSSLNKLPERMALSLAQMLAPEISSALDVSTSQLLVEMKKIYKVNEDTNKTAKSNKTPRSNKTNNVSEVSFNKNIENSTKSTFKNIDHYIRTTKSFNDPIIKAGMQSLNHLKDIRQYTQTSQNESRNMQSWIRQSLLGTSKTRGGIANLYSKAMGSSVPISGYMQNVQLESALRKVVNTPSFPEHKGKDLSLNMAIQQAKVDKINKQIQMSRYDQLKPFIHESVFKEIKHGVSFKGLREKSYSSNLTLLEQGAMPLSFKPQSAGGKIVIDILGGILNNTKGFLTMVRKDQKEWNKWKKTLDKKIDGILKSAAGAVAGVFAPVVGNLAMMGMYKWLSGYVNSSKNPQDRRNRTMQAGALMYLSAQLSTPFAQGVIGAGLMGLIFQSPKLIKLALKGISKTYGYVKGFPKFNPKSQGFEVMEESKGLGRIKGLGKIKGLGSWLVAITTAIEESSRVKEGFKKGKLEGIKSSAIAGGGVAGAVGGAVGGGMLGTSIGAAIGTLILPGIGTLVGGAIGDLIGSFVGGAIGKYLGEILMKKIASPVIDWLKKYIYDPFIEPFAPIIKGIIKWMTFMGYILDPLAPIKSTKPVDYDKMRKESAFRDKNFIANQYTKGVKEFKKTLTGSESIRWRDVPKTLHGEAIAKDAKAYALVTKTTGNCLAAVTKVVKPFGVNLGGTMGTRPMTIKGVHYEGAINRMEKNKNFKEVIIPAGQGKKALNLPEGTILMHEPYKKGGKEHQYGHSEILGKGGKTYSDHPQNLVTDNTSAIYAFEPVKPTQTKSATRSISSNDPTKNNLSATNILNSLSTR